MELSCLTYGPNRLVELGRGGGGLEHFRLHLRERSTEGGKDTAAMILDFISNNMQSLTSLDLSGSSITRLPPQCPC